MSLSTKILIFLGAILLLTGIGFIIYKQIEISARQKAIETQIVEQKELVNNIMRSQNQYATKDDINQFVKDNNVNLKAIQDDLSKLHAEISAVNVIIAKSNGQTGTNIPSTGTGGNNPDPIDPGKPDPYGYMKKEQMLSLNENFANIQVPFGQVGFSAWKDKPWSINILPREYKVVNVVGTDENQRTYFYNKFSVKVADKDYDIKITSAETKQEFPEAKWSWFNPRLYAGFDGGVSLTQMKGEFSPNLNVGIMSYGKYKNQPDLSVLQVGLGYGIINQKLQFVITPIGYNIGKHIPLMNNTYIAPSIHIGTNGDISAMAGLRIGL